MKFCGRSLTQSSEKKIGVPFGKEDKTASRLVSEWVVDLGSGLVSFEGRGIQILDWTIQTVLNLSLGLPIWATLLILETRLGSA